jgi:hypothetical protein
MQQTETNNQTKIQHYVKKQGGKVRKVHGDGLTGSGEPDLDGWIPTAWGNMPFKIEVKTEEGSPSPLQVYKLREYHKANCYIVGICVTPEDMAKLVEAYETWVERNLYFNSISWEGVIASLGIEDTWGIYK